MSIFPPPISGEGSSGEIGVFFERHHGSLRYSLTIYKVVRARDGNPMHDKYFLAKPVEIVFDMKNPIPEGESIAPTFSADAISGKDLFVALGQALSCLTEGTKKSEEPSKSFEAGQIDSMQKHLADLRHLLKLDK